MKYESRILLLATLGPLLAVTSAMALLWGGSYSMKVQTTLTVVVLGSWLICLAALYERVVFPLRTVSNLLAALREGDFSLRARHAQRGDALAEIGVEVNALGEVLREQRLGAVETLALLRRVLAEVDIVVLAFDPERRLRLVNHMGERLLGRAESDLLGRSADELGLAQLLDGDSPRLLEAPIPGAGGRWELRKGTFLERGVPQQLVLLSDLTRALREEERQAWQRLVQVLRHEVNNSLAPIHSLASSLADLTDRQPRPEGWEQDLREGLGVIAGRSKSLNRFMSSYARLTRLPKPRLQSVAVREWSRRVAGLEKRLAVQLDGGPDVTLQADPDQLDQLLINLVRNAVDAASQNGGNVRLGWGVAGEDKQRLELWVEDDGPGLSNPANLFVPFYTTKPEGSGIGLVLSRQIAEAHGGGLSLQNRSDGPGCRAQLRLPIG